jgi:peptide/nickel transport system ATP-binding protein
MIQPVLEVRGLRKVFTRKGQPDFTAVDGVDFSIMAGECVGLVGGSGCGKSTVAQMITRLLDPTEGEIRLMGHDMAHASKAQLRELTRDVQMVFQNPVPSFDPRHTLAGGISESLRNAGMGKDEARARAVDLLVRCGLPEELADRYPRDVSGGQCQRAAIARALACDPALIILDEATSALDVTVQAQIVELLRDIRRERNATYLFICHDLALVQGFCDRVLVMRAGRIVEEGSAASVIADPQHEYTRQLVAAVLSC